MLARQQVILDTGDPHDFLNMDGLLVGKVNKNRFIQSLDKVQISYEFDDQGDKIFNISNLPTKLEQPKAVVTKADANNSIMIFR